MSGSVVVIDPVELRAIVAEEVGRALAPLARNLAGIAKAATPAEPKADPITSGTVDAKAVATALGVDRRELRRLVASGEFPAPMKVGRRRIRWRRAEVEEWIAKRGAR